nr:transposase, MuDR [Tanacetum cinerariifolium]
MIGVVADQSGRDTCTRYYEKAVVKNALRDARFRPVLDLFDAIKEMLMVRFRKKRNIVKKWKGTLNLGDYQVSRSNDNRTEVKHKGKLTFIAFTRDAIWDSYIDQYFTIDKYKESYALEIAPMPEKDQWAHIDTRDE